MPYNPNGKFALDDIFLRDRLREVIAERGIEIVVETGLNEGLSTVGFCRMVNYVIGVDIDPMCVSAARANLWDAGLTNWDLRTGNSPDVLRQLFTFLSGDRMLLFLDAHWGEYWPLPDEIRALPRGKGIVVLHDIKVPEKDFGFDGVHIGGGVVKDFEYELVQGVLTEWSATHCVEYVARASGSYRGAAIVYPK